jgi:hypothetical protein
MNKALNNEPPEQALAAVKRALDQVWPPPLPGNGAR